MRVQCDKKTCRWTGEKDLLTLIPNKEMDCVHDHVCPVCHHDTHIVIPDPVSDGRVDSVNKLIALIAGHGRKFFNHTYGVSAFERTAKKRVYFWDAGSGQRVDASRRPSPKWRGFSDGGVVQALAVRCYEYIAHGKQIPLNLIAPQLIGDAASNVWGYSPSDVKKLKIAASELECVDASGDNKQGVSR
tara:strand:- start:131 stop:694 length:564 start_codon:yes stop_codon:yes gene_type:complete